MSSLEKLVIPLDVIHENSKSVVESPSTTGTHDVARSKFHSRSQRKAVIIAAFIAVTIFVIIAAALIGKYVPEYLRDTKSKCE